jgi:hypothetical protein
MALRVKGRAVGAAVAVAAGVPEDQARAEIDAALSRGEVVRAGVARGVGAESYRLTDAGRSELAALLAAEVLDHAALAALYEEFLPVDAVLKARVSAWQLLLPERRDAGATADVQAVGAGAHVLVERLASLADRFAPYAMRLRAALEAVASGDGRFIASPRVDSLHQTWFELHEDLLLTLGRPRAPSGLRTPSGPRTP